MICFRFLLIFQDKEQEVTMNEYQRNICKYILWAFCYSIVVKLFIKETSCVFVKSLTLLFF